MLSNLLSHSIAPHELSVIDSTDISSTPDFLIGGGGGRGTCALVSQFSSSFPFLSPIFLFVISHLYSIEPDGNCPRGVLLYYCLLTHKLSRTPTPVAAACSKSSRIDWVQELLHQRSSSQSCKSCEPSPPSSACGALVFAVPRHGGQPTDTTCLPFILFTILLLMIIMYPHIQLPGCSNSAFKFQPRVALHFRPPLLPGTCVPVAGIRKCGRWNLPKYPATPLPCMHAWPGRG